MEGNVIISIEEYEKIKKQLEEKSDEINRLKNKIEIIENESYILPKRFTDTELKAKEQRMSFMIDMSKFDYKLQFKI